MAALSISLSEKTEDALAAIYRYSEDQWSAERANAYLDTIEKTLDLLAKTPKLGHKHGDLPSIYRLFPVKKHWIVYRIDPHHLYVVALLPMTMNIEEEIEHLV